MQAGPRARVSLRQQRATPCGRQDAQPSATFKQGAPQGALEVMFTLAFGGGVNWGSIVYLRVPFVYRRDGTHGAAPLASNASLHASTCVQVSAAATRDERPRVLGASGTLLVVLPRTKAAYAAEMPFTQTASGRGHMRLVGFTWSGLRTHVD